EVGLVHHPVAFDDDAVHGADLVGKDLEEIADRYRVEADVDERVALPPVSNGGNPPGQGSEDGRGAAYRVAFESLAAGEHQDHDRAGQILPEYRRNHDGDGGQHVGAEVAPGRPDRDLEEKRDP